MIFLIFIDSNFVAIEMRLFSSVLFKHDHILFYPKDKIPFFLLFTYIVLFLFSIRCRLIVRVLGTFKFRKSF